MEMRALKVSPGRRLDLAHTPTRLPGSADAAVDALATLRARMEALQHRLYAEQDRALLVVLQGMDAAGKDSTIRRVLGHLHYEGLQAHSFREPTPEESAHDFLWRYHKRAPAHGVIGVFNRSWYEGVLIERVDGLVDQEAWLARYGHINDLERLLTAGGTRIVKVFLHISKDEQLRRLRRRRHDPARAWKHNPHDVRKRRKWRQYQEAYRDALAECSTRWAPWHVVPSDWKPGRDVAVAQLVADALASLVTEPDGRR
jgi:PPK2 family polyphosphate:nucleotide phosphotransferase